MKKKFFYRLFAILLLIIISCGILINLILFYMNKNIYNMQLDNSSNAFLKQAGLEIDKNINTAFGIVNQIKTSKEVIEYAKDKTANFYNIAMVSKQLSNYLDAFSSIGCTIGLLKKNDNIVIWPRGTEPIDYHLHDIGLSEPLIENINTFVSESKRYSVMLVVPDKNSADKEHYNKDLFILKNEEVSNDASIIFFIRFYNSILLPQISEHSFFSIVKDGIILSSNYDPHRFKLINFDQKNILIDDKYNYSNKYSMKKNKNYTVYKMSSALASIQNLSYYYVVSHVFLNKQIKSTIVSSTLILFLSFLFSIIVAFLIASKLYTPINDIIGKLKDYASYEEKDEFIYIKRTLYAIQNEKEKLMEIINSNEENTRKKNLLDILNGVRLKDEIDGIMSAYNLLHLRGPLVVSVLEIVNYGELELQYTKEDLLLIKSKVSLLFNKILKENFECELIEINHSRYAAIINDSDFQKLSDTLEQAIFKIETDTGIYLIAAIGKQVDNIYYLDRSFHEALNLLECRFANSMKSVVSDKDYGSLITVNYYYPIEIEKQLITFIAERKKQEAMQILKRILSENFEIRNLGREAISQFIFALVATINRLMQFLNKKIGDFFEQDRVIYLELKMCCSTEQLKQLIEDIFCTIINKMEAENEYVDESIAKTILDFIHDNYMKDISLGEIASSLKISVSYASILFKNKYGKNFKEYLNYYRIQKAKQIMMSGNAAKVKQLAEMVGFTNTNTFIRVFKTIENISPGEYIRKI